MRQLAIAVLCWGAVARATPPSCCTADGQMIATSCGANPDDSLDDSAALNLALQCPSPQGTPSVRFPDGRYIIALPVSSSLDDLTLTFGAGSVLELHGAGITLSGARNRLSSFRARLPVASTSVFAALDLEGTAPHASDLRFEVTADVPSATLLRVSGDRAHVSDVTIASDARAFLYGVSVLGPSGAEVKFPSIDNVEARLDPNDAHRDVSFGALLYLRAHRGQVRDLTLDEGSRMAFPSGVVVVDGHRNVLENPHITATGAQYGVYRTYGAEFLTVEGGVLDGNAGSATFRTGSEGIYNSQFAGHLKLVGTAISGWDYGVGFHGSHDTPNFYGAVVANNGTSAVLVDSHYNDATYGEGDWPVSGFVISGMYFEEQAHTQEAVVVLKTGAVYGMTITGSYLGFTQRAVKVYPGMGSNVGLALLGNRLAGAMGAYVAEPNANSSIWVGNNEVNGAGLATGTYAGKLTSAAAPGLTSLTLGTSDGPITGHYRYVFTANFGTLGANATAELSFTAAAVAPTDSMNCTVQGASLAANVNLAFTPYISTWSTIVLRAYNTSSSSQTGVTGSLFCDVWKH